MTTGETSSAHGGRLIDLLARGNEAEALRERAAGLRPVRLSARTLSDLELLAVGGFSPLDGFMTQADYKSVVTHMHLASGAAWPIPVTLAVSDEEAEQINEGSAIALTDISDHLLAVMDVREKFG